MEEYLKLELWLRILLVLSLGTLILGALLRALRLVAKRVHFSEMAFRPILFATRWAGTLLLIGLVLREFGVDLMAILLAALGLVAIGVVAVWSMLSHMTATMLLILLKPFGIGDTLEFPGEEVRGMLVDLNLFFACLRDENGNEYIIPANTFFQKTTRKKTGEGKIELIEQFSEEKPYEGGE